MSGIYELGSKLPSHSSFVVVVCHVVLWNIGPWHLSRVLNIWFTASTVIWVIGITNQLRKIKPLHDVGAQYYPNIFRIRKFNINQKTNIRIISRKYANVCVVFPSVFVCSTRFLFCFCFRVDLWGVLSCIWQDCLTGAIKMSLARKIFNKLHWRNNNFILPEKSLITEVFKH